MGGLLGFMFVQEGGGEKKPAPAAGPAGQPAIAMAATVVVGRVETVATDEGLQEILGELMATAPKTGVLLKSAEKVRDKFPNMRQCLDVTMTLSGINASEIATELKGLQQVLPTIEHQKRKDLGTLRAQTVDGPQKRIQAIGDKKAALQKQIEGLEKEEAELTGQAREAEGAVQKQTDQLEANLKGAANWVGELLTLFTS